MVNFRPDSNITEVVEKINSFIVIIAFSVTLDEIHKHAPSPLPPKKFLHAFFFSAPHPPPTRKLAARSLSEMTFSYEVISNLEGNVDHQCRMKVYI